MKKIFQLTLVLLISTLNLKADSIPIYLIPGQGSDSTIFTKLTFPECYEVKHIKYVTPYKNETMSCYAERLSNQITDEKFVLVGVSLGGMLSTEIADILYPDQTIIISSAKHKSELPRRYTFQKHFPIYRLISPKMNKLGAKLLQPIVEPDRNKEKAAFKAMLDRKDPIFLNRTIAMIINWERRSTDKNIIHIHGDNDHTVPIRNVDFNYKISNGSHMMTLTRANEISEILAEILDKCS